MEATSILTDKRPVELSVDVSQTEWDIIQGAAEQKHLHPSEFIRMAIFEYIERNIR